MQQVEEHQPAGGFSISFYAFDGCIALKEFVSLIQDPSKTSVSVDDEVSNRAHLIVPRGTKANYLSQWQWNKFRIFEEGETVVDYADTYTDGQGLTYKFSQSATAYYYTLTGYTGTLPQKVVIPETVNGLPVGAVDNYVFRDCTGNSISFPKTVSVNSSFFSGCSELTLYQTVAGRPSARVDRAHA